MKATDDFSLSDLDTFKNEIIENLDSAKHNGLEKTVFRLKITNSEYADTLVMKNTGAKNTKYTTHTLKNKNNDLNLFDSLLHNEVKVKFINNIIGLRSNLTTNRTIKFIKKSFSTQC